MPVRHRYLPQQSGRLTRPPVRQGRVPAAWASSGTRAPWPRCPRPDLLPSIRMSPPGSSSHESCSI